MLSAPLAAAIEEELHNQNQVILFLNRRGFDTFVLCTACGHAFHCQRCSVSLTYHRFRQRLLCHYCGFEERLPSVCPACQKDGCVARRGFGTEKIADAVAERFPSARVARLDRDVVGRDGGQKILQRVAKREVDVLVGTQMVAKGHDFPGVTLVGVLCADTGLSLPDFRASEKTFQLLTQVAGRAGRGDRPGRVLIQTYRCESAAIATAAKHDYAAFYRGELRERQELGYPPTGFLVAVRIDGSDSSRVIQQARRFATSATRCEGKGVSVLGPSEAPLARLKGRTRWHLWLRAPDRVRLRGVLRRALAGTEGMPGVRVSVDVDPVSAL